MPQKNQALLTLILAVSVSADAWCIFKQDITTTTVYAGSLQPSGKATQATLTFGEKCKEGPWYNYSCIPCGPQIPVVAETLKSFAPPSCGFKRCNSNGCSVPGNYNPSIPGTGLSVKQFWAESCLQHDFCYADRAASSSASSFAKTQSDCDDILRKNMEAQCDTLDGASWAGCKAVAGLIRAGLSVIKNEFDNDRAKCVNGDICGSVGVCPAKSSACPF